ncbi:hypothetical protein [Hymenobacter defluvii]|uniref:Lipoprotein n=1 Tax=Hymenobacter defluvii TaxID=2054411 RepID=A0ABS3THN7_9BACT|nr:hypothetical protein [Hymenobacter defluvii]MBO3273153.1 hypothetical protein [Hymenobacter defluvii]
MSPKPTVLLLLSAVASLAACTPPYHPPQDRVEWHLMNHTGDTLLLTVRYRLDSAVVSASDVPRLRQAQTADSLGLPHLRIGGHQPLDHLARHQGHWYWVRNAYATALPYWSDASGNLHPAATNRTAGVITYKLVPGGGHEVAAQLCQPSCDTLPLAPASGQPTPSIRPGPTGLAYWNRTK